MPEGKPGAPEPVNFEDCKLTIITELFDNTYAPDSEADIALYDFYLSTRTMGMYLGYKANLTGFINLESTLM